MLHLILRHWALFILLHKVVGDIDLPTVKYDQLGDEIGLLGRFNALSFYNNVNDTQGLSINGTNDDDLNSQQPNESNKLYIRNNNHATLAGKTNGQISNLQLLSNDTILITGNFTQFNDASCQPPIIYNITSEEITNIFASDSTNSTTTKRDVNTNLPNLDGEIKTTFIDGDLIYIGGDFTYENSSSIVIYNQTSKNLIQTPFQGFGNNSIINTITKIFDDNDEHDQDLGSIIFGGKFDTLGIPELLQFNLTANQNSTNHTNSTNSSLIVAEQKLSLKHGIFTDVNGDGSDPSTVICPSTSAQWSPMDNSGGQWLVELPNQMQGLTPTKARLYVPEGSNSINLFRIYSYPNNGIMNLTYIDPSTNELKYCDAWCPLSTLSNLNNATNENIKNYEDFTDSLDEEDLDEINMFIDENDGTYSTYYDGSTKTKTLSYAKNFQEFAFENEVEIDKIGITVISWYGSKGSLAGFELYLNSIVVYGNETLNEPNCGTESSDHDNLVKISDGDFQDISSINPSVSSGYMVSTNGGKVTMYPNITYSGDYSLTILTPGCLQDNSCSSRAIVNVTVFDTDSNILSTNQIWQNNDYDKFDYLYYGHLDGSTLSEGQNSVVIEYDSSINSNSDEQWMVIDKIKANIVELDNYYDQNSTNHTHNHNSRSHELTLINLNGLFEYSLSNFSDFDISKVYNGSDDNDDKTILKTNKFVGNSSINVLSSELKDVTINQLNLDSDSLVILGDFESDSDNLTLSNANVINLTLGDYNTTSNSSTIERLTKREILEQDFEKRNFDITSKLHILDDGEILYKREIIFGGDFNDSITQISNYYSSRILLGKFQLTSDSISNLSSQNKSTSEGNNFIIYQDDKFYSFGNDYIDEDFDSFTNITLKSVEYFVFSSSTTGYSITWDNTNKNFITNPDNQLNITQVVNLPNDQQIISGSSFEISDISINNIAFINSTSNLTDNNFNVDGEILESFYINKSVSVIGGEFSFNDSSNTFTDLAFISNDSIYGISYIEFNDNSTIQTLYVDSNDEYLIVGYNGSVTVDNTDLNGGVVVYDLQNNTVSSFQPADLSNSNNNLQINSIVLYNEDNKLLVGGNFDNAGSLDCSSLCIYNLGSTQWESPTSGLSGNVHDIKFIKSNEILIVGDLQYNNNDVNFLTYDMKNDKFNTVADSFNKLPSSINNDKIQKILISDDNNDNISNLSGKLLAYTNNYLLGYDGSKWSVINGINVTDNSTQITDFKLISSSKAGNDKYFSNNNVLLVAGQFNLSEYGLINLAMYDGKSWYPWVYSTTDGSSLGKINSILLKDQYRLLSSDDIKAKKSVLSSGKVVGISLACAIGSITVLGLLYIIPYFLLFRRKDKEPNERIGEREMMNAVNPGELFHEIDLHRNH